MTHIKHTLINKKHVRCSYFDHIVHISDIHIRPLDRHSEYTYVFRQLNDHVKKISKKFKIAVAITGDIFDNKTVFKPETFFVCKQFIKDLANIAPVFVINGNHDMLESNVQRMDALTPVLSDLTNVHYFSLSGIYEVNDYLFSVLSLQDTTESVSLKKMSETIRDVCKNTNKKVIGMYHGTIQNVLDFKSEKELLDASDFDYCNITLLGDIHRRQLITPKIGYAGSLIQQNHGESMDCHGGILWDIHNESASFFDIKNKYGFVDIICVDGVWVNKHIKLPDNAYVRLMIDAQTTEYQVTEIMKDLDNLTESCHVTSKVHTKETSQEPILQKSISSTNEITMIKQECNNLKLNEEVILGLHEMYKQEALLQDDNTYSSCIWKPEKIEFKNLFGFNKSKVHTVEFSNGIHSIQAANGVGKTSIINALLFGIYGKTPLVPFGRGHSYDIINNCETLGYVHVYFDFNNVKYILKRYNKTAKRSRNESFINTKLQSYTFYVELFNCGNSYDNPNKEKVSETGNVTDEIISKMFGDIEYFLHSNMLDKEASKDIASSTAQNERLRILKKIFHLDYYDDYKLMNTKNMKNIKTERDARLSEIKGMESLYQEVDIPTLKENYARDFEKLETINSKLESMRLEKENYDSRVSELSSTIEINSIKLKDAPNVTASQESLEQLTKQIKESKFSKNTRTVNNSVEWYDTKISSIKHLNDEYSKHIVSQEEYNKITELETSIRELEDFLRDKEIDEDEEEVQERYYAAKSEHKALKKTFEDYNCRNKIENELTKQEILDELKSVKLQRDAILKKNTSARSRKQLETELYYLRESTQQEDITQEPEVLEAISNTKVEIELLRRETKDITAGNTSIENLKKMQASLERKLVDMTGVVIPNKIEITEESLTAFENANNVIDNCNASIEEWFDSILQEEQQEASKLIEIIDALPYKKVSSAYVGDMNNKDNVFKRIDKQTTDKIQLLLTRIKEKDLQTNLSVIYVLFNDLHRNTELLKTHTFALENNHLHDKLTKQKQENNAIYEELKNVETQLKLFHLKDLNKKLKSYEQSLVRIQQTKQILDIENQLKQFKSSTEIEHELNDLDEYINELEEHLNFVMFEEITAQIRHNDAITKELKDIIEYQKASKRHRKQIQQLESLRKSYDYYLKYSENLKIIDTYMAQREEQQEYENYIKLTQMLTAVELTIQNKILEKEYQELLCNSIIEEYTILSKEQSNLHNTTLIMQEKIENYEKASSKIKHIVQEIKDIESHLKNLEDYDKLISNKGLPSKILYDIIKSIEYYINGLITSFIQYKLEFLFDYDKQYLEILCMNTDTNKMLSFQRLSGYEKCVVRIALKRAINKFSCNSKSSIVIIDEAFDCIDEDNFIKKLPQLIMLLNTDYDLAIIVSQRDISHVADKVIKIKNNTIISV